MARDTNKSKWPVVEVSGVFVERVSNKLAAFHIPQIDSRKPTNVDIDPDVADELKLNEHYFLALFKEGQKRNVDGSKPNHYFYELSYILEHGEPQSQGAKQAASQASAVSSSNDDGMNRRTALMQAVALAQGKEMGSGQVLVVGERFYRWLSGRTRVNLSETQISERPSD